MAHLVKPAFDPADALAPAAQGRFMPTWAVTIGDMVGGVNTGYHNKGDYEVALQAAVLTSALIDDTTVVTLWHWNADREDWEIDDMFFQGASIYKK